MSKDRKKHVLILGAGASKPYGFPLGRELVELIQYAGYSEGKYAKAGELGMSPLPRSFTVAGQTSLKNFTTDFVHSGADTIDSFLDQNSDYAKISSAVISYILLSREAAFKEYWSDAITSHRPEAGEKHEFITETGVDGWWHTPVVEYIKQNFKSNNYTIVDDIVILTFNYDRSISIAPKFA